MNDLEKIRNEYSQKSLRKEDVMRDPLDQFEIWFDEVLKSDIYEPTSCTLSTASQSGRPSGRMVLLKGFSKDGFNFFTNYKSRKGKDLIENPFAALTFFWKELERQIRIEGSIIKTNPKISDDYFASRPTGSKIGAWASPQSEIIADRKILERSETEFSAKFGETIPRPDDWGGFILVPAIIEFWQGRRSRLHDRIQYVLTDTNWKIHRLAP